MNKYLFLVLILFIALTFRFTGINWDQNTHLHPDERFLTMVLTDLKIPESFIEYLNPLESSLNPTNLFDSSGNRKYTFFVYGTLPLTLTKLFSSVTGNDSYHLIALTGRFVSALLDVLVVFFIYKTIQLIEKYKNWQPSIKYWAAFLYSISVLPIQLSHFFTVDTFLNAFLFISFFFSLKYYYENKIQNLILSSLFLGLAIASKITAIVFFPMLILIIFITPLRDTGNLFRINTIYKIFIKQKKFIYILSTLIFSLLVVYLSIRLANPYMFEDINFLNPRFNKNLMESLKTLQSWNTKDVWYPPGVQWISKPPITFALYNLAIFGLGIPIFIFGIFGMINLLTDKKQLIIKITIIWVISFFVYQSTQYVKSIRYFIIIYPFICIYAAYGLVYIHKFIPPYTKIISLILLLIWPLSFISIYLKPHSRVTASIWIYKNIPTGSKIAWEVWDDPLPLRLPGYPNSSYQFIELKPFDYDTMDKIKEFSKSLENTDYYILSSNRAWGSIPKVPEKYPYMSKFYYDLFNGKTRFQKIAEFHSFPSLSYLGLPIEFNDESSEEAFTVYDHPIVIIFKNNDSSK